MITMTGATTIEETASGSDSSTGDVYGLCGWNPDKNYYACMSDGGISGMIDRDHPIDCPPDVMEGDPCTEGGVEDDPILPPPGAVVDEFEVLALQQVQRGGTVKIRRSMTGWPGTHCPQSTSITLFVSVISQ